MKTDTQKLEKWFLFASSYFFLALRMSQKQRIKEGVFSWEAVQAIEQNKKYEESSISIPPETIIFKFIIYFIVNSRGQFPSLLILVIKPPELHLLFAAKSEVMERFLQESKANEMIIIRMMEMDARIAEVLKMGTFELEGIQRQKILDMLFVEIKYLSQNLKNEKMEILIVMMDETHYEKLNLVGIEIMMRSQNWVNA